MIALSPWIQRVEKTFPTGEGWIRPFAIVIPIRKKYCSDSILRDRHNEYIVSNAYIDCSDSMRKSFQFRIYPNKKQEVALERTLTTCRHLYNDSLAERSDRQSLTDWNNHSNVFPWGKSGWINYYDQANQLPLAKTAYQKEVYSQVLQNTLKRVDRIFRILNGAGYPRFQGRNRYNSFTYPGSGLKLKEGKLILSR